MVMPDPVRILGSLWQAERFDPIGDDRRRLRNASLLNAMAGDFDDMNLNGILIRCAQVCARVG
jgi:hypothetical protein